VEVGNVAVVGNVVVGNIEVDVSMVFSVLNSLSKLSKGSTIMSGRRIF
jgi:hypothetical protein